MSSLSTRETSDVRWYSRLELSHGRTISPNMAQLATSETSWGSRSRTSRSTSPKSSTSPSSLHSRMRLRLEWNRWTSRLCGIARRSSLSSSGLLNVYSPLNKISKPMKLYCLKSAPDIWVKSSKELTDNHHLVLSTIVDILPETGELCLILPNR
ncbi:hypothetical protein YC2023_066281 [Brassica napus]